MWRGSRQNGERETPAVLRERLRLVSLQTQRAVGGALVGGALLIWLAWDQAPKAALLAWLAALCVNLGIRFGLSVFVLRSEQPNLVLCNRLFLLTAGIAGALPGVFCALFFSYLSVASCYLATTVVIAWIATAVATMSQLPMQLPLAAITAAVVMAAAWLSTSYEDGWLLALASFATLVLITAASRDLSAMVGRSIRMRFANDELVTQLADQIRVSEDANRAKSHFLAAASHDLRQPASSLALFVDALREKPLDDDARRLIGGIERASESLNDLLASLLDLSRLDAGVVTQKPEWVSLAALFSGLQEDFTRKASEKGLQFVSKPGAGALYVDLVLVTRLLRNLLENAVRYTPVGEIRLQFRRKDDRVQIVVEDTGVGIEPQYRERVFDEYFQLSNPSRNRVEGLGLGLAIVRRIAVLLDTSIHLDSSPEGGTAAILEIGLTRYRADFQPDSAKRVETAPAVKGKILIRENDPEVSASLSLLLDRWGYTTIEAHDNVQALETCVREVDLKVAISDYRLPDSENGIELLERVARVRPECKRILITGDTGAEVLQSAIRCGVVLVHKPLSAARIREALA